MSSPNPMYVAIVGAGPAGFYAAQHLLKQDPNVHVDMFDRLPTPYGLVRAGVAPDHQKIKSVTKQFDRTAADPRFRFFGNVEIGKHLSVAEMAGLYHQIIYTTGAQTDRQLGIPGEELTGSHAATEFVAWYNGHPDFRDYKFDLTQEHAVVVGVGYVAIDVARILCRSYDELHETDIADYALEALKESKVKTVYILGRRGPAQAAFTLTEIKEMGELSEATAVIPEADITLDPLSQAEVDAAQDRATLRKLEVMNSFTHEPSDEKPRNLIFRFLVSPTELLGDENGQLTGVRMVHNELYQTDNGTLRPRATDRYEEIPAGLLFRSIGYRG
ncbi:MAG: FAD-dependent oxidoreductase, partial [Anaerolineales bacterium]|nr:FAD-dependent oxidoreductase [Anaerolineales bacterium]